MAVSRSEVSVLAPAISGTFGRSTGSSAVPAMVSSPETIVPSGRTVTVRTLRLARPLSAALPPSSVTNGVTARATSEMVAPSVSSRETSASFSPVLATPSISSKTTEPDTGSGVTAGAAGSTLTGEASAVSTGAVVGSSRPMPRTQ